jgi:ribosomal protein S18 acetylase RimI-like enzyme
MIIRKFRKKDLNGVRNLIINVWDELYLDYFTRQDLDEKILKSYSDQTLLFQIEDKMSYDILIEDSEEIVGICKSSFETNHKILSIGELYLSKKIRGHGLGLKLIQNCVKQFSPDKIQLETHYKNVNAQNFYLKLGFKILEERTKTWGNSSSIWYFMENDDPNQILVKHYKS